MSPRTAASFVALLLLIGVAAAGRPVQIATGFEPDWSPDGTRIAFTRTHEQDREIHVMAADGSDAQQLTRTPEPEFFPRWSPDGTRLAFIRGFGADARLMIRRLESGEERPVASDTAPAMVPPSWSPAGDRLVFAARLEDADEPAGERADIDLVVVGLDDGRTTRLTSGPGDDRDPAWSPDGRSIAFVSEGDEDPDLFLVPVAGGEPTPLLRRPGADLAPTWSPDGRWIAFASSHARPTQLFRVGIDGSGLEQLTSDQGRKSYPAWSPDGDSLSYVIVGEGRGAEDRIMLLDVR